MGHYGTPHGERLRGLIGFARVVKDVNDVGCKKHETIRGRTFVVTASQRKTREGKKKERARQTATRRILQKHIAGRGRRIARHADRVASLAMLGGSAVVAGLLALVAAGDRHAEEAAECLEVVVRACDRVHPCISKRE